MKLPAKVLILSFLAVGSTAIATEKAEIERVFSAAREESLAMEHLDYLSNRIGPRLTSSDGLQNGCEWARDRFKSFGIENARLEKWGEFPVGFNRGAWSGRMIEPAAKAAHLRHELLDRRHEGPGQRAGHPRARDRGTARPDQGQAPRRLGPRTEAGARPGGRPERPAAPTMRPDKKPKSSARSSTRPTPRRRSPASSGGPNDLIVTGGNYQVSWDKLPTVPAINLVKAQFDEVAALVKEGKPVVLEFDIRNYFKKGPIPLFNVIADIPGTEFPDEYVIVGGHIDSWDGATGTTDNGTGCATTLEAARILMKSGVKPRRTIRFMLWSGEEQGLFGSKEYVKAHPELMKKISAVLVHDGGTNYLSGIGATKAQMKSDVDGGDGAAGRPRAEPCRSRSERSPASGGAAAATTPRSSAAGVPGFFWRQSGKAVYNQTHHTQHDTFDRAVPEYQKHSSIVAADRARSGLANLDHLLSRERR